MERKEGLRDGVGGLIGGNAQVSLQHLLSLIFFDNVLMLFSHQRVRRL